MNSSIAATPELFAYLLRFPTAVESVTAALLRSTETSAVLASARDTLWQGLLNAPEPVAAMSRADKRSLSVQAGLLRGFSMGLIIAWRPTSDSLAELEDSYPGFTAYGITLAGVHAGEPGRDTGAEDSRAFVQALELEAKRLLWLGLRHGYGLAMLISDALDAESTGGGIGGPATLPIVSRDDPAHVRLATEWIRSVGQRGIYVAVGDLLSDTTVLRVVEGALTAVSRQHPIAVPATIERYSDPFLTEMVAFLLRWWADVGLRCRLQLVLGSSLLPDGQETRQRYAVGSWLSAYAHEWAIGELPNLRATIADDEELRAGLVQRARLAVALGLLLGQALDLGLDR